MRRLLHQTRVNRGIERMLSPIALPEENSLRAMQIGRAAPERLKVTPTRVHPWTSRRPFPPKPILNRRPIRGPSTSTVFLGPAFTCAFVDTSRLEKSSTYPQRSPMAGAASDGVD